MQVLCLRVISELLGREESCKEDSCDKLNNLVRLMPGIGNEWLCTRVMLQRGFAVCGLDLICSSGLLDAEDRIWLANDFLISAQIFVLGRCHVGG